MTGYLDMQEQTAETLIDGWLHTGDGGVVDERGFVFLRDRLRDVIITGGFNVYPSDVEAALVRHPKVHECVVFGLADDKWGEAVNAAVQLKRRRARQRGRDHRLRQGGARLRQGAEARGVLRRPAALGRRQGAAPRGQNHRRASNRSHERSYKVPSPAGRGAG